MNIWQSRMSRIQELMKGQGVDALLILNLESYFYFIGDVRRQPRLLIPQTGEPTALFFAGEEEEFARTSWIKKIHTYRAMHEMMLGIIGFFSSLGKDKLVVGIEMDFSAPAFLLERFKMANPNVEVVDSKGLISTLRKVKEPAEIEAIRQACRIADMGMKAAIAVIKEGVRELDVAIEAEYAMKKAGAERMAFPIFVNTGYRSQWLHGMATAKKIEKGDLIILDMGPVCNGYCADICRTLILGKPLEGQRQLHQLYREMQKQAIDSLKPGTKIFEIEDKIHEVVAKAGYGDYYVRGFIHGIGLGFEETPFPTIFAEDVMEPILAGMTLSVGHSILAVPGIGGARVEDTLLVTDKGVEILTHFPRELQEVG